MRIYSPKGCEITKIDSKQCQIRRNGGELKIENWSGKNEAGEFAKGDQCYSDHGYCKCTDGSGSC